MPSKNVTIRRGPWVQALIKKGKRQGRKIVKGTPKEEQTRQEKGLLRRRLYIFLLLRFDLLRRRIWVLLLGERAVGSNGVEAGFGRGRCYGT
jgi:hypothetical protein